MMEVRTDTIKRFRHQKGWTQQHLADASSLSLRTIQRVEREGNAAKETVMAICSALNIEQAQLSIIPQVEESQLTSVNIKWQLFITSLAVLIGAILGAVGTYFLLIPVN